jgi:hypothetical protein
VSGAWGRDAWTETLRRGAISVRGVGMLDKDGNEMVVSDEETYRFWIGANMQDQEYIDVTMFFDPQDGDRKLSLRGGTVRGLGVQPRSGNVIYVKLEGRKP